MSDELPKMGVEEITQAEFNQVEPWGAEPKGDNGGWISVEDRLPNEDGVEVICYTPHQFDGEGLVSSFVFSGGEFGEEYSDAPWPYEITHWQDLPLPPMLRDQAK